MPRRVIAELVDIFTGKRFQPGDIFTPHTEQQAARLEAAGCLGDAADADPEPVVDDEAAVLTGRTVKELKALVDQEGLDIGQCENKAQLVAAIVDARATKA